MISQLQVINSYQIEKLDQLRDGSLFVLDTCQRSLVIGFNKKPSSKVSTKDAQVYEGTEAYQFLLEVFCGLQSKIRGEYEVMGQLKTAYQLFMKNPNRNGLLVKFLEKLIKDTKDIRTKHLQGIGTLSYAGIARRLLIDHSNPGEIVVFGSGQLAKKCVSLCSGKSPVAICGRNKEAVAKLAQTYGARIIPWQTEMICHDEQMPRIINTIGGKGLTLFSDSFFDKQSGLELFIDLAAKSVVAEAQQERKVVWTLTDIFSYAENKSLEAKNKMDLALVEIEKLTIKRQINFLPCNPFSWEEIQVV